MKTGKWNFLGGVEAKLEEILAELRVYKAETGKGLDEMAQCLDESNATTNALGERLQAQLGDRSDMVALAAMVEQTRQELAKLDSFVMREVNARTLTLEWLLNNNSRRIDYLLKRVEGRLMADEIAEYWQRSASQELPAYSFACEKRLALDSLDQLEPESTYEGIVPKPLFVQACERIKPERLLKVLDVGCGAGRLVFDFLKRGHLAIGIDGSDSSRRAGLEYWNELPYYHTCDITRPFEFRGSAQQTLLFDFITMWEVFEHIPEEECGKVLANLWAHLSTDGIFVGSISRQAYVNTDTGQPYHVTLKEPEWWMELFAKHGFEPIESPFLFEEYCRGVGESFQDLHNYQKSPELGFHFVVRKKENYMRSVAALHSESIDK